ncbi:hypothetical protein HNP69_001547 [Chryseobacterium koreense]|nr:hypothetical protein [Chryseobacterium koreense]
MARNNGDSDYSIVKINLIEIQYFTSNSNHFFTNFV